jgi:uncharacterized protein (TIGR00297 family)
MPDVLTIILGIIGAAVIAVISYHRRSLDRSGAAAAFFIGSTIFICGGPEGAAILLTFFIGGTLISYGEHPKRTARQVLANGSVPAAALLAMTFDQSLREPMTLIFLGSLATASADTFATEIGMRYGGRVYNVITFRPMQRGLSGGVTLTGIGASLGGAMLIAVAAAIVLPLGSTLCGLYLTNTIIVVTIAGICGSLIDSFIGAALQAKYRSTDGAVIETAKPGAERISGLAMIGNNATNFIASVWGGLLAAGIASMTS